MGKSHPSGWVSLRGNRWFGYFRQTVLDPETNQARVKQICVKLTANSKLTKREAREALRVEIGKRTGESVDSGTPKDGSVTFEWFVRNRYFPLRKGDWRPETAKEEMAQIEIDLISRFGEYPLDSFDRFMLETHLHDLARKYSQDRVKHAWLCLKSIFDEAIEEEFLVKDPTRKVKIPKNLRPKGEQVLSWEELWMVLANTQRRDRLLLMLDMTAALRPSTFIPSSWMPCAKLESI